MQNHAAYEIHNTWSFCLHQFIARPFAIDRRTKRNTMEKVLVVHAIESRTNVKAESDQTVNWVVCRLFSAFIVFRWPAPPMHANAIQSLLGRKAGTEKWKRVVWPPAEPMSSVPIFVFFCMFKDCVCAFLNSKWRARCVTIAVGAHAHGRTLGIVVCAFLPFHLSFSSGRSKHMNTHATHYVPLQGSNATHAHSLTQKNEEDILCARRKLWPWRQRNGSPMFDGAMPLCSNVVLLLQTRRVVVCMRWCVLRVGH